MTFGVHVNQAVVDEIIHDFVFTGLAVVWILSNFLYLSRKSFVLIVLVVFRKRRIGI